MKPLDRLLAFLSLSLLLILALPAGVLAQDATPVSLPNLEGLQPGDTLEVPITIDEDLPESPAVQAFDGAITYDPEIIKFTGNVITEGTLSEVFSNAQGNVRAPGDFRFGAFGGGSLSGTSGTLIRAEVVVQRGGTTPLTFDSFQFNEGDPPSTTEDGSIEAVNLLINEIDYDQPSTDMAEFIELYNVGSSPANLGTYTLELVNGASGGADIYTLVFPNEVTLQPGEYYVICANEDAVPTCDLDATGDGGESNFIQNGSPDAVGLRNGNSVLVDVVSYEGDVPGYTEGSGVTPGDNGDTPDLSIARLPDGQDTNNNSVDFQQGVATPGNSNTVIPVELAAFEARADGEGVLLLWQTASETNNAGFQVQLQRPSADAFTDVEDGFIASNVAGGTTTEAQQYRFRVENLLPGTYRFRLKQTDFDGAFEYSPVVEAEVAPRLSLRAYPNPFRTEAQLELTVPTAQSRVTVEVYNILGQRVALLHDGPVAASEALRPRLSAAGLSSGLYLIRVQGETFAEVRRLTLVR